ncbi:MAG: prephenate dehydrogenase [Clostridia bacterium]|nr:prephenate dehydrogenase [Clostridia bacterium]
MKIAVIGLGLIGGSIVKGFKKYTDYDILGYDKNDKVLKKALSEGSIDGVFEGDFDECDIVVLGLYPEAAVNYVREYADKIGKNVIITDCGGVKEKVCGGIYPIAMEHGFTFIGMHPMAGLEKFGYDNSIPDLFDGASLILTPYEETAKEKVQLLADTMCRIGFGRVQMSTPSEHDKIIAYTSQLAHVVSGAYIKSPTAMRHAGFSAGSFRDMTRVAHLNETMWTELFMDNPKHLADEIDTLIERLKEYSDALKKGDKAAMFEILKDGREKKDLADRL